MNPVSIQHVYRAESGQRARQYDEIQLLNQAYPRRQRSSTGSSGAMRLRFRWLRGVASLLGSWAFPRPPQPVSPVEGEQAPC
jgi:hypothetical protein